MSRVANREPIWSECVGRFCEYLQNEERASGHTVVNYRRDLEQFGSYASQKLQRPAVLRDVDRILIRAWLSLIARRTQPSTLSRKLSSLRSFYRYLDHRDVWHDDPTQLIRNPRVRQKLPRLLNAELTGEVVEAPLRQGDTPSSPTKIRDRALLELLYGSGLRVGELVGLNVESMSVADEEIRVIGKGRKERIVPIGARSREAVQAYLTIRGAFVSRTENRRDERALFLSRQGRRISIRWVQRLVRQYGELGAGRADVHPHTLRHCCATHMLEGGADLRAIQEMLGHSNLSTTQRYTQLSAEQLVRVYDAAHPLARRAKATKTQPRF